MRKKRQKRALSAIFIVIFFQLTSLGMVVPLIPVLAGGFQAGGLKVGLLLSSYSIVQFLCAPFWGRLSDIFGRKTLISIGLFGSSTAYFLLAFSGSWGDILLSQILAGFFGANVAIASAYISDVTSPQNRSKNIGLIGAAFGAGFTLGPLFGFGFMLMGEKLGAVPPYGTHFVALSAGLFCLLNAVMSFFFLKDSRFFEKESSHTSENPPQFVRPSFGQIWTSLKSPRLGFVLLMSFVLWFVLAQIEPILILFVQDDFLWNKTTAYGLFVYIGILMVFSQGWLVRKWIPKWGESFTHRLALQIMALGLFAVAGSGFLVNPDAAFFSPAFFILIAGVTFFALGYSVSNTCLRGAISLTASSEVQGSVFGVHQSISALARTIGPLAGGWFYDQFSHDMPFLAGGVLIVGVLFFAVWTKRDFPNVGKIKGADL